ncbi:MAG: hypothetical protein MAG431_00909 [Chloroflexi bacterium]|nr:hypothetical protein [Chloroflexota bacterium]
MDNILRFWRENTIVRILLIGCIVFAFFLAVRDPWSGGEGGGGRSWKVQLFIEVILFGGLLAVLMAFFLGIFSFFVLPLRRWGEWIHAWPRLLVFMMGSHGQAIWVKDGSVEDSKRNAGAWRHSPEPKPGVLILDGASGAQFKTSNRFTRTCGPGLTFMRSRETLAGMVFLGRQVSFPPIRPADIKEAFAPQGEHESDEEYGERVDERKGVSGHTRDGVEALPFMLVGFRPAPNLCRVDLGPEDDVKPESCILNPFKYNPVAVRRAVNADALNSNAQNHFSEERHIPWDDMPGYLVAELWREFVRKFTLTELFREFPDGHDFAGMTALEVIRERVKARLTQPNDVVLDTYGNVIRQRAPSREYHLLREWGIQVKFAPVRNPCFSPEIEETLVKEWFSFWKWRAEDERKFIQRKRSYMRRRGRIHALSAYVKILLEKALPDLPADLVRIEQDAQSPQSPQDQKMIQYAKIIAALSDLLEATRRVCISDIELARIVGEEETKIQKVIDWLNWLKIDLSKGDVL